MIEKYYPSVYSAYFSDDILSWFDSIFAHTTKETSYPPYNFTYLGDHRYVLEVAVAGFSKDRLSVETDNGQLVIQGKPLEASKDVQVIRRGIANRSFIRKFVIPENTRVDKTTLEDGMLYVYFTEILPEHLRPTKYTVE